MNIVGPPLGKVAIVGEQYLEWNINQALVLFRPKDLLLNKYLYYYLVEGEFVRYILHETKGTVGQVNISLSQCRQCEIPLPPLNEQRRIVEKIEALTARSRKAREAIEAIPELLDQFRQSVLAAAFRGDLTADWREQNPDVEPAEALLERIRVDKHDPNQVLQEVGRFSRSKTHAAIGRNTAWTRGKCRSTTWRMKESMVLSGNRS
jgi:type I restriction enzyme S subunit